MIKKHNFIFLILAVVTLGLLLLNICMGSVSIPVSEVFKSLFVSNSVSETWQYIIINYRLPKAIMAILAGIGLSVAGLLMQTLFRNPLAGPYVLGLSSGSSLGVAFVVMGAGFLPAFLSEILLSTYGIIIASCLGSFVVLTFVLSFSAKLRDTNSILIIGLMFSGFTSAIVGVLTYFSSAEQLQKFTFWSMGSLGNVSYPSIALLAIVVIIGLILAITALKSMDALLLGENYAKSLGLNIKKSRFIVLLATSILAGSITAFAGPIAFVGLAVPHIAKIIFKTSNHDILFVATLFFGAITMLACDMLCFVPWLDMRLPINAVTSIIGAPIVICLIVRPYKNRQIL